LSEPVAQRTRREDPRTSSRSRSSGR
jgi:hypothetical protein